MAPEGFGRAHASSVVGQMQPCNLGRDSAPIKPPACALNKLSQSVRHPSEASRSTASEALPQLGAGDRGRKAVQQPLASMPPVFRIEPSRKAPIHRGRSRSELTTRQPSVAACARRHIRVPLSRMTSQSLGLSETSASSSQAHVLRLVLWHACERRLLPFALNLRPGRHELVPAPWSVAA